MVSFYKPGAASSYSSAQVTHTSPVSLIMAAGIRAFRQIAKTMLELSLFVTSPPLSFLITVFFRSFYCLQLEITETVLPFHFQGTHSKLHPSKMWRRKVAVVVVGWGRGALVWLQFQML